MNDHLYFSIVFQFALYLFGFIVGYAIGLVRAVQRRNHSEYCRGRNDEMIEAGQKDRARREKNGQFKSIAKI